jgi:hypothetical protein
MTAKKNERVRRQKKIKGSDPIQVENSLDSWSKRGARTVYAGEPRSEVRNHGRAQRDHAAHGWRSTCIRFLARAWQSSGDDERVTPCRSDVLIWTYRRGFHPARYALSGSDHHRFRRLAAIIPIVLRFAPSLSGKPGLNKEDIPRVPANVRHFGQGGSGIDPGGPG